MKGKHFNHRQNGLLYVGWKISDDVYMQESKLQKEHRDAILDVAHLSYKLYEVLGVYELAMSGDVSLDKFLEVYKRKLANRTPVGGGQMSVYLATHDYFDDYEILGVFATKQAAQECIDKYQPKRCVDTHKYRIEEYDLQGLTLDNNKR